MANGTTAGQSTHANAVSWRVWLPTVALFQFVYIVAHVHRQILSIVVGPVKASLGLSDLQIGLLQGFAFTAVIAVTAVMTAPIVDKGNRVRLVGIAMAIWCTMTIGCGLATNFGMMLFARTGLAIAEAVIPMAVLSLICDIVPRSSVPRAASLFIAASFLGSGFMLLGSGPLLAWLEIYRGQDLPLIGALEPWRGLFFVLGAPGLMVGLLILAMMREPARQDVRNAADDGKSVLPFLWANRDFFVSLLAFTAITVAVSYVVYAWMPTYMIRVHGYNVKTAGLEVGSIFVTSGIAGCMFGAWIMSRSTDEQAMGHVVRTMVRLFYLFAPALVLMALAPNATVALILLAIAFFLMSAAVSSVMTPLPLMAPPYLRGRVTAVGGLVNSAIGGLGPLVVGAITDIVFKAPDKIGDSLALTFAVACIIGLICGPRAARIATRIDRERAMLPHAENAQPRA